MRWFACLTASLVGLSGAWADPKPDVSGATDTIPLNDKGKAKNLRLPIVLFENLVVTVPPAVVYWSTPNDQKEDWALHWDWPSWKEKLGSADALVLDTNRFEANAIRHPLVGALTYQIGRSNGMSPLLSTAMAFGTSFVWEYFVEFKEQPSVNDLVSNTTAGFLVGEPLFQIGLLADRHGTPARRALALLVSPFHRAQKELGLSPLVDQAAGPNRLEIHAGLHAVNRTNAHATTTQVHVGLDLETFRDPWFGRAGEDAHGTGLAAWNRVAAEVDLGGPDERFAGAAFRSSTTYAGLLARDLEVSGYGHQTFAGVGAGFEVVDRRLPGEWEKFASFELVNPRVAGWWHRPYGDLDLEAGVAANVAMVQATALALDPLIPDSSVVLTRGYYYATGATLQGRARLRTGRWTAEVESVAHQFWSFDEHSHGGTNDPRDLADGRVTTSANLGVAPFGDDLRVELYGRSTIRRGTGDNLYRETRERELGLALRTAF